MYSIIVAVDEQYGIGYENTLPWTNRADLKQFKQRTIGQIVIMGRKTWESLPSKPLKNRVNIVLTHQTNSPNNPPEDVYFCDTLDKCIRFCDLLFPEKHRYIIGGAQVYELFLQRQLVSKIYLTKVHHIFQCDTFFPSLDWDEWKPELDTPETIRTNIELNYKHPYKWTFQIFLR